MYIVETKAHNSSRESQNGPRTDANTDSDNDAYVTGIFLPILQIVHLQF